MSARRLIGLWAAAAAVLATTGAARAPDDGTLAHAASAATFPTPAANTPHPSGNVVATIPVAAFGPADGIPLKLVAGLTYPVVITVWVAATSGPAVVTVGSSSSRLVGTTHTTVRAGITRLHYALVVTGGSTHLTVAVNARTHEGITVTGAYNHSIS